MQSRHRVEEFIAAYNHKDTPGALACFTQDAIYQDVTYGTTAVKTSEENARTDVSRS